MSKAPFEITAAVLREPDAPYRIETLTVDRLEFGQIAVRISGTGFCHTDMLPRLGGGIPLPMVTGHEGAGVVQAVGDGVDGVSVGDHVVLSFDSCHQCKRCLAARPAYCDSFFARNMSGRGSSGELNARDITGRTVSSRWFGQSSFADIAIVDGRNVVPVEKDLPLALLGPLGCGFQTGAGVVLKSLAVPPGAAVAVFGAGAVGLAAVMAAAAIGASSIIAVDRLPTRLELSRSLGATHAFNADDGDVETQIRRAVPGGVDFSIDTTGRSSVLSWAIRALNSVGVCGLVGAPVDQPRIDASMLASGRAVKGIIEGDAIPRLFVPELIALWRAGRFPFTSLVESFALGEINEVESAVRAGRVVKPILHPD